MASLITPVSGKFGRIRVNGNELYLESWQENVEEEQELYSHFGMTADANGVYFKDVIGGYATGDVTIVGKHDNTAGAFLPSNKGIWVGATVTTGFLGVSQTVGYQIQGRIKSVKPAQGVDPKFGAFEAVITLTACVFTAAGP